jgi:hypothetical protein
VRECHACWTTQSGEATMRSSGRWSCGQLPVCARAEQQRKTIFSI